MRSSTGIPGRVLPIAREIMSLAILLVIFQVGLVQAYNVPTGSMEETIRAGDCLLAEKLTLGARTPHWLGIPFTSVGVRLPALKLPGIRHARRGDIVVVEVPVSPQVPYVKRVVAIGGDRVEVRDKRLYVNGSPLPDPERLVHGDAHVYPRGAIDPRIPRSLGNRDNFGPVIVPVGFVFLMGDNRDFSLDSRYFGSVPERNIIGRARVLTFSVAPKDEGLPPWRRIGLDRIGTVLR